MIGRHYYFNNHNERYKVCGEILDSVKRAKVMLKMKHVKRYIIVYKIFDKNEMIFFTGNASNDWKMMKDKLKEIKVGKINVQCIEEYKMN